MQMQKWLMGAALAAAMGSAGAVTVLSENFDDVSTLAVSGWVLTNNSDSPSQPWFQGNPSVFAAFAGTGYVAANFLSSGTDSGAISNWLITPLVTLSGGETLTFYARKESVDYADALTVRLSSTGSSDSTSFTTTLTAIASVSTSWTQYTVTIPVLAAATSARVAFEYNVPNALNADYIGVDNVAITAVPEPATAALVGLGLAGLAGLAIRRRIAA